MTSGSVRRPARDWSKEPWIKQHVRESLDELLAPLIQRALRDYLRKRAEADGTLIVEQDRPIEALLRALGAHEPELELARDAVAGLLRLGLLETDGRSIWMPERPESQVRTAPPMDAAAEPLVGPISSKQTSTHRVREHRERRRNERNAQGGVSSDVSPVADGVSPAVSPVADSVSPGVSSSRGVRNQDPPHSGKDQKDQRDHLHHPEESAPAPVSVSPPVSSSVSSQRGGEDGDDETFNNLGNGNADERCAEGHRLSGQPRSLREALAINVAARAALVVDTPALADTLRPDQWPEVQALPAAFAAARGCVTQPLGRYAHDSVVKLSVALYAAGYSRADLVHVVSVIAKQEWTQGKGLASLLTFKVVDNNRLRPPVKAERALSPRAALAVARAREGDRIRKAG